MTFSSLISGTIPSHGKYNTRPGGITRVIQHHWADTTLGGQAALENPNTKKSVNYLVHNDGIILGQVPEEFRPWTSGGPAADNPSITIECQNSTGGPEWAVSNAAINSIARLLADIATRRGFGSLTPTNYRGHREFAATACPGPYLWPRLQSIRDAANALHGGTILVGSHGGVPVPVPAPVTAKPAPAAPTSPEDLTMKPWFIRRKDGAIVIVGPTGVRALALYQWVVWQNLGYTLAPGMDAMDPGPFGAVIESLGGLV